MFKEFQELVLKVFGVTFQNEEELSFHNVSLVLGCLLEMHSQSPKYAPYENRLKSFQYAKLALDSDEMARAGFHSTGREDETVCSTCGLGFRDWQTSDQPFSCHSVFANSLASKMTCQLGVPTMSCLYMAVCQLLFFKLPLIRKHLCPNEDDQLGVIHSFKVKSTNCTYPSLSARLHKLMQITFAPITSSQSWPVLNATSIGHSLDLIVLAMWKMHTHSEFHATPTDKDIELDPHESHELLRSILRIQEKLEEVDNEGGTSASSSSTSQEYQITRDLPPFATLLQWWDRRWRSPNAHSDEHVVDVDVEAICQ